MEVQTASHAGTAVVSAITLLAHDEDEWYRRDASADSVEFLRDWLRHRPVVCSHSANPLADDEDAWARS